MESPDLARMRETYARDGLEESAAGDDPMRLFGRWLDDAVTAQIHEPNAMALATSTPDGRPSVRIVLLKGIDESGMTFYTNYESRKGHELEANPRAAAALLWHPLQRQVRVEGPVTRIADEDSDAYFHSRPHGSQLGALASPQSAVIADRAELDAHYAAAAKAYSEGRCRALRTGAATGSSWSRSSSGRAASPASTIDCATYAPAPRGRANASRPSSPPRSRG